MADDSPRTPSAIPALSIVIPAFDAAAVLGASLAEIANAVGRADEVSEIVVVDDGSSDGTAAVVEAARGGWPATSSLRLLTHRRNRGKGAAVRTGMIAARGAHRVFTDADLAYGTEALPRLRAALDAGADVAAGVRARHRGTLRRVAGWGFSRAVAAYGLHVGPDPQCGLKAFTSDAAAVLFGVTRVEGFAFDVELLHVASRWGLRVERVPVIERGGVRHTSVSVLRDAPRMLEALKAIRATTAAGEYEAVGPKPRFRKVQREGDPSSSRPPPETRR